MKSAYVVAIVLALFLVSACGPTVNAPADEKAIKDLVAESVEAGNNRDLDWLSSNYYTEDSVILPPNGMPVIGLEAILAREEADWATYSADKLSAPVEEVQSSGDLAVVRGTYYWTATPVASGLSDVTNEGKWIATFNRQDDGSWICSQLIYNNDRPAAGATADGADEEALLQISRDWANALVNKDRAALDSILAADFVGNDNGETRTKRQNIARVMGSAFKIESIEITNMQPMVFGDTGVVHGVSTGEGTISGSELSGQHRWTDIFERRDGRWQAVASYGTEIE